MKFLALVFCLPPLLLACTTVENDASTNYNIPLLKTQIDFQPPDSGERMRLISRETKIFEKKETELKERLAGLDAQREILFTEIADYFPECKRQRHCMAAVAKGDVKRFERYNEISKTLVELDRQVVNVDADLSLWRRRYELRVRSLYNRYLAFELLQTPKWNSKVREVLVHSLEAYPDRRALTYRLIKIGDQDLVPTMVGDLEFRMMSKPIDEAAILASFDVRLHPDREKGGPPERYLVTYLINSHQLDPQFYEKTFLKEWSRRLSDSGQSQLKKETFCGIYSIASPMLAPKLSGVKSAFCTQQRVKRQAAKADSFDDRFDPENWLVPITYTRISE